MKLRKRTKHDVVAFIESVAESVGPSSKYIHMGATSSDILDTSFACLLKEAAEILINDIENFMTVLQEKAFEHKFTPMIGRTHGIHAEPITFGLKMAHFYDEMRRNLERMRTAKERVSHGKISGAVGTFAHLNLPSKNMSVSIWTETSSHLNTNRFKRLSCRVLYDLAIIASSIEKMSLEVRNLQRTEVGEAEEFFSKGQTGSSAMPHKRNPIASENLCGLARLLRGYALSALRTSLCGMRGISAILLLSG